MRAQLRKENYAAYDKGILPEPVAARSLEAERLLL